MMFVRWLDQLARSGHSEAKTHKKSKQHMKTKTKRMDLNFNANVRLLMCDWNQGWRNTGDSAFML